MSKNLTRKGLALGALIGLATTAFAGAPAQAANEINLVPIVGTTFDAPVDNGFELKASLPSGSTGSIAQLLWQVTTTGDITVNAQSNNDTDSATKGDTTPVVLTSGATNSSLNVLGLELNGNSQSNVTQTAEVTAFLDSDNTGDYTAGEWKTTVTVTFRAYSEITTSTTITAPVENDSSVVSYIKYTNVNNEMVYRYTNSDNTYDLGDYTGPGAIVSDGDVRDASNVQGYTSFSAATGWKIVDSTSNGQLTLNLAKDKAVRVQPTLDGEKVGTAVTAAVSAATLDAIAITNVVSTTATDVNNDGLAEWLNDGNGPYFSTDKAFQVKISGTLAGDAVAGVEVKVGIAVDPTLSSTVKIEVNGVTYTSNSSLPGATAGTEIVAGKTDANGDVVLNIKTTGFDGAADVQEWVKVYAKAAGITSSDFYTYASDPIYVGYVSNSLDNEFVTTDGAAVAVEVTVKDQFGALADDNTLVVTTDFHGSSQTTNATDATETFSAVSGGKATLSILDNGKGTGLNEYYVYLKTKAPNGNLSNYTVSNWDGLDLSDYNGNGADAYEVADIDINIVDAADTVVGKVVIDGGNTKTNTDGTYTIDSGDGREAAPLTLSTKAFFNWAFTTNFTNDDPAYEGGWATINGSAQSASSATYGGVAIPNSKVTVSGAGMMFYTCTGNIVLLDDCHWSYGDGSLTTVTDANGNFSFEVNGHLTGAQVVTITSGTSSAKVTVYFDKPAQEAATKVAVVVGDGAAQFQAGRALDVKFTVTDKFGNVVDLTNGGANTGKLVVSQTGAGYLTTLPTTTSAGVASSKLITNFGDLGTSTISAKVDFVDTDATDLAAVVASSEFGVTDVTDISAAGKAIYVNTEFAKGKVVTVYIDGKRMPVKAAEATDNAVERKYTQKVAGKHTVVVRISGGVVATERVITTK